MLAKAPGVVDVVDLSTALIQNACLEVVVEVVVPRRLASQANLVVDVFRSRVREVAGGVAGCEPSIQLLRVAPSRPLSFELVTFHFVYPVVPAS